MTAAAIIGPKFYGWDNNGDRLAGGNVYAYEPGTNTPKATYTDETATTQNPHPVVLNASGFASIYLVGTYKIVLTDADDVEIWTEDPVTDATQLAQEWVKATDATQVDATSFTVDGNQTETFVAGRRVRLEGDTILYGDVDSSSYTSPSTTVTVSVDDDTALTADLSRVSVSNATPLSVVRQFKINLSTGRKTLVEALEERSDEIRKRVTFLLSISEIKGYDTSNLSDGDQFHILSYNTPIFPMRQFYGGGMFSFTTDSLTYDDIVVFAADDEGGYFVRQIEGYVTPEMAGAVGNGTDNVQSALESALVYASDNGLGLEFLSGGNYLIDELRCVNDEYVPQYVDGHGCTLTMSGNANQGVVFENPHGQQNSVYGFYAQNFYVDATLGNIGVYVHGMQRCALRNIYAEYAQARNFRFDHEEGYGIYYNEFNTLRGRRGEGWGAEIRAVDGTNRCNANDWIKCDFNRNKGNGFRGDRIQDDFYGCSAEMNDLQGFRFENSQSITFVGGYTENNHMNQATDGESDGTADESFRIDNVEGFKLLGGRHIGTVEGDKNKRGNIIAPTDGPIQLYDTRGILSGTVTIPANDNSSGIVQNDDLQTNTIAMLYLKAEGSSNHAVYSVVRVGSGVMAISQVTSDGGSNVAASITNSDETLVIENNTGNERDIIWSLEVKSYS